MWVIKSTALKEVLTHEIGLSSSVFSALTGSSLPESLAEKGAPGYDPVTEEAKE